MDDTDFTSLARSYGYDQRALLVALRRAGLTSLAVSEELGANVSGSPNGVAIAGGALLDAAQLSPLADPLFAGLARRHAIDTDAIYVIADDAATARRYAMQLPLKFAPHTVKMLRAKLPAVWAIETQSDYFSAVGLGLPDDRVAMANALALHLVPRLQDDESMKAPQIDALVGSATRNAKATTVIFSGLRNEVLGYPDHIAATAAAFRAHHVNFGTIEYYDQKQDQLGNEDLARLLPERTVRVQAIAKPEADKLKPEDIVERYMLGVRERNVRVVYVRPIVHQWNGRSIEASNVELIRRIAAGVRSSGKKIGPASPFGLFQIRPLEIIVASLAVPAIALLVLAEIGVGGWLWIALFVAGDLVLVGLGYLSHHDVLARKALALAAGLVFPTAGLLSIGWIFRNEPGPFRATNAYARAFVALGIAIAVTLGGALVITGLMSTPMTMLEIDRFSGVKYVLVLPALIALGLYFFTDRFAAKIDWRTAADSPVRVAQLVTGVVLVAGAFVVLQRSGNQSDIAPSTFELALRAHLTTLLAVRPRFKEFVAGFPALMLVAALLPIDRKRWGWMFVVAIGLGLGDLIDTFSHFHTPLVIGAIRVINGTVLGALFGAIAIAVYRRLWVR
jgi:hypothetical protein